MKTCSLSILFGTFLFVPLLLICAYAEDTKQEDGFFRKSLHSTTGGMAYWYDKKNGGLEALTGIPYHDTRLDCCNCHVASCDVCHTVDKEGALSYSVQAARDQAVCLRCHKRARAIMKIDKEANQEDVHFSRNMGCVSCHTARDVHGDGRGYSSMKEKGAIDAQCEKCHESIAPSASHKIHGDKLECKACPAVLSVARTAISTQSSMSKSGLISNSPTGFFS